MIERVLQYMLSLEEVIYREVNGVEVLPLEVYRDMFQFGTGHTQNDANDENHVGNPVAYFRNNDEDTGHFRIMFLDQFEEILQEIQRADFAILNGLSYFGRKNIQQYADQMFAMIFDLDGQTPQTLRNFFSGALGGVYPLPNYVILSGHGVHLYYLFEEPIKLYPYLKLQLKELKYQLAKQMWNKNTSTEPRVQQQGINQGFRVIGGRTKIDGVKLRAFKVKDSKYSLHELCSYVPKEYRVDEKKLYKESKITLEQAKQLYPEWYQRVVVDKDTSRKLWDISGKVHGSNPYALYDWWYERIRFESSYGHRYFACLTLAVYGIKCGVPFSKVKEDAMKLLPVFNLLNPDEPFTEDDVLAALECHDLRYCTFPIRSIETLASIPIKRNKRNGRTVTQHTEYMRTIKAFKVKMGECVNGGGRKSKKPVIEEWQKAHPYGTVRQCIEDTGLSAPTVYKYWTKT